MCFIRGTVEVLRSEICTSSQHCWTSSPSTENSRHQEIFGHLFCDVKGSSIGRVSFRNLQVVVLIESMNPNGLLPSILLGPAVPLRIYIGNSSSIA